HRRPPRPPSAHQPHRHAIAHAPRYQRTNRRMRVNLRVLCARQDALKGRLDDNRRVRKLRQALQLSNEPLARLADASNKIEMRLALDGDAVAIIGSLGTYAVIPSGQSCWLSVLEAIWPLFPSIHQN